MTESIASELEGIVAADANTAALVTRYAEAKRAADEAEARVKALRGSLLEKFDAASASKFSDDLGDVLIARTEVQGPERVDIPMLKRIAPEVYSLVVKPGSKFYRINLPRIRRG